MNQNCSFCHQPCVINCMNRSLYHKHNEEDERSGVVINELLSREKTSSFIKYMQVIIQSDKRQCMIEYLSGSPFKQQLVHLQEYYKFRIYVPLFAKSRPSDTVLTYYYEKLKHYYNSIKRKLHITVDPSSSSGEVQSISQSNISTKQELLKDIKYEIELEKKKKVLPNLINFKSQSKALQELVSYMKLNSRFEQIKTLKTEDCFQEQCLFEQTISKRSHQKIILNEPAKSHIKSKLFKKVIQSSSGRKTPIQIQSNRQRPPSRSKSIKIVKCNVKELTLETEKTSKLTSPFRIKEQQILKQSRTCNSISKRHSSLGKLNQNQNQNHYSSPSSPYKRKSLTKQKVKAISSASLKQKIPTIEPLRPKIEQREKIKDSIVKMQTIKFQNEAIKNKTTPNSPSSKKVIKQNFQVLKNDNILSIRKKKLELLKQKAYKK